MLGIILTILKVIGIILLCILGLVLLLLLLVLLVPVRYQIFANGNYEKEKPENLRYLGGGKVTWLLHLVSVTADYTNDGFGAVARLLGIPIVRLGNRSKKQKKKKEEEIPETEEALSQEPVVSSEEPAEIPVAEPVIEEPVIEESVIEPTVHTEPTETVSFEAGAEETSLQDPAVSPEEAGQKPSLFEKITGKIKGVFEKVKTKVLELTEKIRKILEKVSLIWEFLDSSENQDIFALVIGKVIKLLKRYLPRRLDGYVDFSLDNPSLTGRILSIMGMIYPVTADHLELNPGFGEEVYVNGDIKVKGHIRVVHVLTLGLSLILNKKFRAFLKRVKKLKNQL